MQLEGAVINFLGDSITEGVGASETSKRYTDVLAKEFGLKAANNYGIGGTRIARQLVMTDSIVDRDFCMRMEEMDPSADAVVVFGGTNDYDHGSAPLGTPQDRDPSTFWGACHYLMNRLLETYVGKPVVILTPLHRDNEVIGHRGEGAPVLQEYRQILMTVAEYYALPVLDLYATSGIQPHNPVCRERLLPDGLHPSDEGHALIAHRLGMFLQNL